MFPRQCLIRGAKLEPDTGVETMRQLVYALQTDNDREVQYLQGADEYCRAAEMYGYISTVTSSQAFSKVNEVGSPARSTRARTKNTIKQIQTKVQQMHSHPSVHATDNNQSAEKAKSSEAVNPHRHQLTRSEIIQAQDSDQWAKQVKNRLLATDKTSADSYLQASAKRNFEVDPDGALVRVWIDSNKPLQVHRALYIPDPLVEKAMVVSHQGYENGHPGFTRTYQTAHDRYWWQGMYRDIQRHVQRCHVCQMQGRAPSVAPIAGHIKAQAPGEAWVVDMLHMTTSENGYTAIMVAVDVFSRYAILIPVKSIESDVTSEQFKLHVLGGPAGIPKWVLTDNGSEFQGEFEELCQHFNIDHKVSAPGHAQSHGMVERLIATSEITIAHFIDEDMKVWDRIVAYAQMAHNSKPHPALSKGIVSAYTPAEVFLGRKLVTQQDRDLTPVVDNENSQTVHQYAAEVKRQLQHIKVFVQSSQARYHTRMEQTARNRRRQQRKIVPGLVVKLYKKPRHKKHAKLWRSWQGPYKVVGVSEDGANVDLKHVAEHKVLRNQNIDNVRLYFEAPNTAVPAQRQKQPAKKKQQWEVVKIMDDQGTHGVDKMYLVRWKGDWDDTWEPEDNLNCPKLVESYHRTKARNIPTPVDASTMLINALHTPNSTHTTSAKPWSTTIQLDLTDIPAEELTTHICNKAGISVHQIAGQFAFVPCETYSVADHSNITRGHHHRDHSKQNRPPKDFWSQKGLKAVAHDHLVEHVLMAWMCDRDNGINQAVCMENPRASLRRREFMHTLPARLGMHRQTVDFCAFGHEFKKPTDVWTNLHTWQPTGRTGTGRCEQRCGQGAISASGRFKHFKGLAQEPIRGPRGKGANRLKNSIPQALSREWIVALQDGVTVQQNTIIDLCAGYQSLKPVALAMGFNYVAVDIAGDRNFRTAAANPSH